MNKPHIVIIGSGFGGVYAAKHLLPAVKRGLIDATIVSKTNSFLFTPLLHEVATGSLGPSSVAESLREIFAGSGISILQTEIQSVDTAKREVVAGVLRLPYHSLMIATGSAVNYYGIHGAQEYTLPLKTLSDAHKMKERIVDAFERAALESDDAKKKEMLSFVVVGAGPTGVELVMELAEFAESIERRYFRGSAYCCREHVSLTLVSASAELLPMADEKIRKIALKKIQKRGINVFLSAEVKQVMPDRLMLGSDKEIPAGLILWAAGVRSNVPEALASLFECRDGRIMIDDYLRAKNHDDIYVIGDASTCEAPAPMLAQAAIQQAKVAAHNILASITVDPLVPFVYRPKGFLVSLGQWAAAGDIFGVVFSGPLMWFIWRTVYLFKFGSWNKRIRIAFDWTIELFFPRDTTKLH